jgi:hypothetical protein
MPPKKLKITAPYESKKNGPSGRAGKVELGDAIQQSIAPAKNGSNPAKPNRRAGVGIAWTFSIEALRHQILCLGIIVQ